MSSKPGKRSSDILVKVGVKKFSSSDTLEDLEFGFNNPSVPLSSKIGEYMVRIGDSNDFCFNIIIQLLIHGKVRVDFRDSTERLHLESKQDIMSRADAVRLFDEWVAQNRSQPEPLDATLKLVLESPKISPASELPHP